MMTSNKTVPKKKITGEETRQVVCFLALSTLFMAYQGVQWLSPYLLVMFMATLLGIRYQLSDRRMRRLLGYSAIFGAVVFSLFHWLFVVDAPAYAALFDDLQGFLQTSFPQATEVVDFIFNGVTLLLLVYFTIAIVNIVRAILGGQEILVALQTPAIMVIVVAAAQLITQLLLG